jgi:hypothetical protein
VNAGFFFKEKYWQYRVPYRLASEEPNSALVLKGLGDDFFPGTENARQREKKMKCIDQIRIIDATLEAVKTTMRSKFATDEDIDVLLPVMQELERERRTLVRRMCHDADLRV